MTGGSISNNRPRLLMVAYACRPDEGSEPGLGWNRAIEVSRHFDTWVICEGTRCEAPIRAWLAKNGPVPGLEFVYVPHTRRQTFIRELPGGLYPAYNLWHRAVFEIAKQMHAEYDFDLVHQTTYASYREPGYVWQLPIPFVWGPVGGTHNFPWRFLGEAGFAGALQEGFRSLINNFHFLYRTRIHRAVRSAALVMAGNTTTQRHFRELLNVETPCLVPTNGVGEVLAEPRAMRTDDDVLRILWCGYLHPLKGLSLLLRAVAELPADKKYVLRVVGQGPYAKSWRRLADRLGISEHVEWTGWIPHSEALRQYAWADVFVHSALRDTLPGVILESLASGVPVICLDHLGMGDTITADCGIKVPLTTPTEVVSGLSRALATIKRDPLEWNRLSRGAIDRAKRFRWSYQGEQLTELYEKILQARSQRTQWDEPVPPNEQGTLEERKRAAVFNSAPTDRTLNS